MSRAPGCGCTRRHGGKNYHAIPDNLRRLGGFLWEVGRAWRHALMRRSQRSRMSWARFRRLLRKYLDQPQRLVGPGRNDGYPSPPGQIRTCDTSVTLAVARPTTATGSWRRRISVSRMVVSVVRMRFLIVRRTILKPPSLRRLPQQCVNPRKSKVSGLRIPRSRHCCTAYRPKRISRVFSRCSCKPNGRDAPAVLAGSAAPLLRTGIQSRCRRHNVQ